MAFLGEKIKMGHSQKNWGMDLANGLYELKALQSFSYLNMPKQCHLN
jgi:hypothetical protein